MPEDVTRRNMLQTASAGFGDARPRLAGFQIGQCDIDGKTGVPARSSGSFDATGSIETAAQASDLPHWRAMLPR